jgi:hypothetical protein
VNVALRAIQRVSGNCAVGVSPARLWKGSSLRIYNGVRGE